ncbi:MAG TPA: DUF2306 domain-containing protein [Terriglobales bacterium]|nr:DUF2306 domain-containing protein [Terriglobales bacterium]
MHTSPILLLHICCGTVGLLSGAVAITFRKGSRRHAIVGKVFVVSMLGLGASATYLAILKHQTGNLLGGVMTFYLVTTAWLSAKRRNGETGLFDWIAFLVPLGVGFGTISNGIQRLNNPAAFHDGVPAGMSFFLGAVLLSAAAGDLRMLLRGISGKQRIARHLWRMCFGLFIASGSIFIARPKLFPKVLSTTHILLVLGVLPLILLIFWMVRVRFSNAYKLGAVPSRTHAAHHALRKQPLPG